MDVFHSACMLACGLYLLLVIERVVYSQSVTLWQHWPRCLPLSGLLSNRQLGDLLHCLARSNNNVLADIVLYVKGMLQQGK